MSNPISSPYADFIQEQKKQKYLKKIDAYMVSEYNIEFYNRILKLQKSILSTLKENNKKILNKNILEKINNDINKVLPYSKYGYFAYHKKPNDIYEQNKIYIYSFDTPTPPRSTSCASISVTPLCPPFWHLLWADLFVPWALQVSILIDFLNPNLKSKNRRFFEPQQKKAQEMLHKDMLSAKREALRLKREQNKAEQSNAPERRCRRLAKKNSNSPSSV